MLNHESEITRDEIFVPRKDKGSRWQSRFKTSQFVTDP